MWQDENQNGISERNEVHSLPELGMTALSFQSALNKDGMFFSKDGVTFATGETASTVDWLVPTMQ
ncbi:MAG: hypothetical protein SGJ27_14210 [Candidatus Melainabacteria bacterium]|nr:hypothetical protein [Candidatus Melainabacteria bacterium]